MTRFVDGRFIDGNNGSPIGIGTKRYKEALDELDRLIAIKSIAEEDRTRLRASIGRVYQVAKPMFVLAAACT